MYLPTHLERVKGVVASAAGEASEGAPLGPHGGQGARAAKKKFARKIYNGGQRRPTSGETKACYLNPVFRRPPPNLTTP
jgi:hypothetical protein